jgi:hypothetical protein
LKKMLATTEFDWIKEAPTEATVVETQTELDLRYYRALWEEVLDLPKGDRIGFETLIAEEIESRTSFWALRLRVNYGLPAEELQTRLVDVKRRGKSLAAAARRP